MSHKYYGFQQQEENNLYTIPFISTKTQKLRFLNNELVGYGQKNEFIVHKNPGLTILRLSDNQISRGFHYHTNTNKLMVEFLNNLIYSSDSNTLKQQRIKSSNPLKIKEVKVNSRASIQIRLSSY